MNERIIEMAKQCGYWSGETIEMNDVGIAKFAELIVRECCEVAHCNFHADGLILSEILKEHFGVEE
jgi:hypothetical protein